MPTAPLAACCRPPIYLPKRVRRGASFQCKHFHCPSLKRQHQTSVVNSLATIFKLFYLKWYSSTHLPIFRHPSGTASPTFFHFPCTSLPLVMTDAPNPTPSVIAPSDPHPKPTAQMSDVERIKAAQAARRTRRARPPTTATNKTSSPTLPKPPATVSDVDNNTNPNTVTNTSSTINHDNAAEQELTNLRLELSSLRRNHLQNIKKLTEERDMFATQLAREQTDHKPSRGIPSSSKKIADLEVQLRAARTRNNDLETENSALRDDVKQLNFRVQASRTLDAASDGYEKVVDELVEAKLKCAQLLEEKEDLLRLNKEAMTTSATLTNLNGELEKSRSEWVVRCADLEKQRADMESKLKASSDKSIADVRQDTSYSGSDLQELKLN